jgi:hypothetical protein
LNFKKTNSLPGGCPAPSFVHPKWSLDVDMDVDMDHLPNPENQNAAVLLNEWLSKEVLIH